MALAAISAMRAREALRSGARREVLTASPPGPAHHPPSERGACAAFPHDSSDGYAVLCPETRRAVLSASINASMSSTVL